MTDLDLTEKILSACSGSILTSLLVTPLDVVKVRMQSSSSIVSKTNPAFVFHGDFFDHVEPYTLKEAECLKTPRIRGTWAGLRYIVENEGAHNLWRGLSPTLMMAVPATMIYLVSYEAARNKIRTVFQPKNEFIAPMLAGSTARVLAATVISPLELVRTNMQHLGPEGTIRNVFGQVMGACRTKGVGVLFKGLVPTLWRDVPFSAIYWATFESVRSWIRRRFPHTSSPTTEFAVSFVAGAASGALAAATTTPFDVAKTRTQVTLTTTTTRSPKMLEQLRSIWRTEGLAGLTRGIVPRIIKVSPACAIMIGSYELCKAVFAQAHIT